MTAGDDDLTALALRYGCDKWSIHRYTPHYHAHFSRFRYERINILEIGIGGLDQPTEGGRSLRMWRDYFPNATIYGLDIKDKKPLQGERIKIYQGSQDDPGVLQALHRDSGGFQIVIDDGSHVSKHVITTFKILFPLLNDGGIYAIEDLQTAYWPVFGGSIDQGSSRETSMKFLTSLVHGLNWEEFHRPGVKPSYFEQHIVSMHFYHNLAFIYKGTNREGSNLVKDNVLPERTLREVD